MFRPPLTRVKAKNFLSLEDVDVELRGLNVLVGPNGSGKTNFLKVFAFIGEIAERDLAPAIESLGGAYGLPFQNKKKTGAVEIGIEGTITRLAHHRALDEYSLRFSTQDFSIGSEQKRTKLLFRTETFKFKRMEGPGRRIKLEGRDLEIYDRSSKKKLDDEDVSETTSGLALLRRLGRSYDADQVEEIAQLFLSLRLVDVNVRRLRESRPRLNRPTLQADGSNIAEFLIHLSKNHPESYRDIETDMLAVLPSFERFEIVESGGGDSYLTLMIKERFYDSPIPLERSSFGTIRAIVLFSMLNDPEPPQLTCIEEIDHGFHPQALDRLVTRMREATDRTQIIVATHSPALVNRVQADELVIFRRDGETGGTTITRPDEKFVNEARTEFGYELGELWFAGLLDD